MTDLDSILKSRDITLPSKVCTLKAMVFLVVVYECEIWTKSRLIAKKLMLSNCSAGEDSWESLGKEIKRVSSKGNQPCMFFWRTDAETEAPILWPPDVKSWVIQKHSDAGKYWRQKEKEVAEDEMASITDTIDMNLHKCWETVEDRGLCCATVHWFAGSGRNWATQQQQQHYKSTILQYQNRRFGPSKVGKILTGESINQGNCS